MSKKILWPLALIAGLVLLSGATNAAADEFYKGQTVRFVVGFAPGGGYDTYTRAVARHIGKHIPGNPGTVVENMDGAGSLIAANTISSDAGEREAKAELPGAEERKELKV